MKRNIFIGFLLIVIGILLVFLNANFMIHQYFEHILYYWVTIILICLGFVFIFKKQ